ncbi:MAG: hypothetical protein ACRDSH_20270, partial [Pseudonocardiaceae bacterium]
LVVVTLGNGLSDGNVWIAAPTGPVINMTDESAVVGQGTGVRALIAVMSVPVSGVMVKVPNVPAGGAALASSLIKSTVPATTATTNVPDTSCAKIFLPTMSLTSFRPNANYGICANVDAVGAGGKSVVGTGTGGLSTGPLAVDVVAGGCGGVDDAGDVVVGGVITVGSGGELDVGAVAVVGNSGEIVVLAGGGGLDVGAGNVEAGEVGGGAATVAAAAWAATPGEVSGPEGTGPGADCVGMTPVRYARAHNRTMFT